MRYLVARAELVAPALAPALVVFALAELLLLRTATRVAIHIPASEALETPYLLVAGAGRIAYSAAGLLALIVVAAALPVLAARPSQPTRVAALVVAAFLSLALLAPAVPATRPYLDATTGIAAVGIAAATAVTLGIPRSTPFAFLALSALAAALAAIVQAEPALPRGVLPSLFRTTEALALAFALSAPLAVSATLDRRALAAGALGAAIAAAALLAPASSGRIILLWNAGLDGALPAPLYIVAAASFFAAVAAALGSGQRSIGLALLLVSAAGFGLHSSYQSLLLLAALLIPVLHPGATVPVPLPAGVDATPPSPQPASRPSIAS